MSDEPVLYDVADHVATITLNRPAVRNAMNTALREALLQRFTALAVDDDEQRRRIDFRQVMERCPQPIIAAIRGVALGGGLELALACDIRIAGDDALLGLTEVNLAIIPGGGGTQRLPRLIGRGKALEMILTGARISAAEALRLGIVERVVPVGDVMTSAMALARELAGKAPLALRYAKEAVVKGLEIPLAEGIRLEGDLSTLLRTTEDRLEGARAFLEKRKPSWKGK